VEHRDGSGETQPATARLLTEANQIRLSALKGVGQLMPFVDRSAIHNFQIVLLHMGRGPIRPKPRPWLADHLRS